MPDAPTTAPPGTATPAAAPASKTPEKPAALTEPQLKGVQRFATTFLTGEKPPPEKPETPEEKAARETKEKETADKEKAKTAPKAPAKPKVPARKPEPPKALTGEEIAEAAARGVATAMQAKPDDTKPAPPAGPELSDAEKRRIGVLEQMEKMFPEKYKGLSEKYKTGLTALAKYAEDWEKAHPGEPFQEDAEEHEEFFSKNSPDWEDEDYTEAVAEIRTSKALEEERKKTNERLSKFERAEKLRTEEPNIAAATTKPASMFWKDHGEDFGAIIKEDGSVDAEKFKALQAADPVTFGIRLQAAQALDSEVRELYKVMNGLIDYDKDNPIHRAISTFADQKEQELSAKPQEERLDGEGRDFLPAAKYYKLSKEKRKDYWTFGVNELGALRAAALADWSKNLVKSEEEKLENWAKARGLKKPDATEQPQPTAKTEEEETPETTDGKPLSPSTSSESRMAATKNRDTKATPDFTSTFLSRQLGK